MTQVTFALGENNASIHTKLNQSVQGWRFLRRNTFIGLVTPIPFNCHPRAGAILCRMIGPGGGGGGGAAAGTGSEGSAASGGGAGGYYEFFSTDDLLLKKTFTIFASPGGVGGTPGSPGTSQSSGTAITYPGPTGSTLILAKAGAGLGGSSMTPGNTMFYLGGGVGGIVVNAFATTQDIFMAGEVGGVGKRINDFSIPKCISGRGGNTVFHGCGAETSAPGAGKHAASFGGGGGGGSALGTTGQFGGNGGDGLIIMDEYF